MPYYIFASTYGSSSYNSNNYNGGSSVSVGNTTTTTAQPAEPAAPSGSVLANTGFSVVLAITLACLIVFSALLIRFWKRPGRPSVD